MRSGNILLLILVATVLSIPLVMSLGKPSESSESPKSNLNTEVDPRFKEYWYQGKAEISSYTLEQSRYGEIHPGYAVLVFVTEDFSRSKQVKLDNPPSAGEDAVSILKLNYIKKFNTGVYRYSIMESVFTPVDMEHFPHTLKTTTSTQEWCGHTFTQLNLRDNAYDFKAYSYFESEGDRSAALEKAFLEDEIWNRIRISPKSLPQGEIKIIPGSIDSRLLHREVQAEKAVAQLREAEAGEKLMEYTLTYPKTNRSLQIRFEKEFPHKITEWSETYPGIGGKTLTTKARLKETIFTDYWNKNSVQDTTFRKKLGLS